MKLNEFALERIQSLYENTVEYNLSDSGVHPYTLSELLSEAQIEEMLHLELGYGWTNGRPELRQTIANLYDNRGPEQVIVTNGSAEANFLMVMSLLDAGDELIVVVPNYLQISGWANALGVKVLEVPLEPGRGWAPDFSNLDQLVSERTKMVTICHPNNPTGSILAREDMHQLTAFAQRHDLYLHADEVYRGAEFDGAALTSFADLYDKSIVTSGLSKAMAMPGLRLGWLVGPAPEIYEAWKSKDYTSITTTAVSEYVATIVLQPDKRQQVLDRSKRYLIRNLKLVRRWVDENSDWVSFIPPKAGGMAFIRYHLNVNSTALVHDFRQALGVFLLPGDVYGMDGYFRVGIGAPTAKLEAGLNSVAAYVRQTYL
jgi:aspartate/methionine/tyrosine aminotransferase